MGYHHEVNHLYSMRWNASEILCQDLGNYQIFLISNSELLVTENFEHCIAEVRRGTWKGSGEQRMSINDNCFIGPQVHHDGWKS